MIFKEVGEEKDIMSHALDMAIFGRPVGTKQMLSAAVSRYGPMTSSRRAGDLYKLIKTVLKNKSNIQKAKETAQTNIEIEENDSAEDIYGKIKDFLVTARRVVDHHCGTTRSSVFYQFIAMRILAENNKGSS